MRWRQFPHRDLKKLKIPLISILSALAPFFGLTLTADAIDPAFKNSIILAGLIVAGVTLPVVIHLVEGWRINPMKKSDRLVCF